MCRGKLTETLCMYEGETVYDWCWYPLMSSQDPATSVFLTAPRDKPLHLWDAYTGGVWLVC